MGTSIFSNSKDTSMNRVKIFSLVPAIGLAVLVLFSAVSLTAAEEAETKLSLTTDYLFDKLNVVKSSLGARKFYLDVTVDEKGGKGKLTCDPNSEDRNEFGDPTGSTEIAYYPMDITLERVKLDDPEKKGRRVYEVKSGDLTSKVFLVVSPKDAGPSRLIVHGKATKYVFPLHDPAKSKR
jgi:hypothetical protein